ncbi:MAG: GyrI-like domain-containing protein [Oscillospiraceae bacterium]
MPVSLQEISRKIFSEWLPACGDYTIAEGICIEVYDDAAKYKNRTQNQDYYSEMWIPVVKK